MRHVKFMLLVVLAIGAVTLADGIEVLRCRGIEVLPTGEATVMTQVSEAPGGASLQAVMVIDGIEVLAEQIPVPPMGGMFPMHFPVHQAGNRVKLVGPQGDLIEYYEPWECD